MVSALSDAVRIRLPLKLETSSLGTWALQLPVAMVGGGLIDATRPSCCALLAASSWMGISAACARDRFFLAMVVQCDLAVDLQAHEPAAGSKYSAGAHIININ